MCNIRRFSLKCIHSKPKKTAKTLCMYVQVNASVPMCNSNVCACVCRREYEMYIVCVRMCKCVQNQ